jgi:hypothetical protein
MIKTIKWPIVRVFPEEQLSLHANHFVVQPDGPITYLMFFQIHPPVVIEKNAKKRAKKCRRVKSVKARCVARIAVAAEMVPEIVAVIQENLKGE